MSQSLHIEVFFDFICPWCLLGKRQLERALARLHADLPATGVPFAEFYRRRLGSEQAVRLRQAQVREAASAAGVDIDFTRILRMPNSADAHRLLQRAAAIGSATQVGMLLERLFAAYFHDGEDLGDPATLLALAQDCGFAAAELTDCLYGDGRPFHGEAAGMAGGGVPCFVFDRCLTVSGAQSSEVLLGAMHAALQRREHPA